jgi:hypothetical protein
MVAFGHSIVVSPPAIMITPVPAVVSVRFGPKFASGRMSRASLRMIAKHGIISIGVISIGVIAVGNDPIIIGPTGIVAIGYGPVSIGPIGIIAIGVGPIGYISVGIVAGGIIATVLGPGNIGSIIIKKLGLNGPAEYETGYQQSGYADNFRGFHGCFSCLKVRVRQCS